MKIWPFARLVLLLASLSGLAQAAPKLHATVGEYIAKRDTHTCYIVIATAPKLRDCMAAIEMDVREHNANPSPKTLADALANAKKSAFYNMYTFQCAKLTSNHFCYPRTK